VTPAKSLAPVKTGASSNDQSLTPTSTINTDAWGMPIWRGVNVQRSALCAPPAKSLMPVKANAVSNDQSLAPTSAECTDPRGTPIQQCVSVQLGPAFPEGKPLWQSVNPLTTLCCPQSLLRPQAPQARESERSEK